MPIQRVTMIIHGRVQGVSYRASTEEQARRLSLSGTVRNLSDGCVEVVAEGTQSSLEELVDWCHRGPEFAEVTQVELTWMAATNRFDSFRVVY